MESPGQKFIVDPLSDSPQSRQSFVDLSVRKPSRPCTAVSPLKIKPGLMPHVTNHRWLLSQPPVASRQLDNIKEEAKRMWIQGQAMDTVSTTSYGGHFHDKVLDEPTKTRPSSPTRRNKPHPPQIFLTNRLHYVNGFHNANPFIGSEPYQVDANTSREEQEERMKYRQKFEAHPRTPILNDYIEGKVIYDNTKDQLLQDTVSTNFHSQSQEDRQAFFQAYQKPLVGSLHRLNRYAGPMELQRLSNAILKPKTRRCQSAVNANSSSWQMTYLNGQTARSDKVSNCSSSRPHTAGPSSTMRFHQQYKLPRERSEYLIHPGWPSTLPHHRVP